MEKYRFSLVAGCILPALTALAATHTATGQQPIIIARTGVTSHNLPHGSSIGSSTVALNDLRHLAIRVTVVGGTFDGSNSASGVFFGSLTSTGGSGEIVHLAPNGHVISDTNLNQSGTALYLDLDTSRPVVWDSISGARELNVPLGMSGATVTDCGRIGGRMDLASGGRVGGAIAQQAVGIPRLTAYFVDSGVASDSPYSFLFVPSVARSSRHLATKVQRTAAAGGGDQIRRFAPDGSSTLIASTATASSDSPFASFINSVAISDDGTKIAFQARLQSTSTDVIMLWDASTGSLTRIAQSGTEHVNSLDAFAPDVNNRGQVVFRGNDMNNRSSVFMYDGTSLVRVAGVGDQVMTDIGLRELGRRDGHSSQSGAPRINNLGDVAFAFQYFDPANPNSICDGTLVIVTPIPEPRAFVFLLAALTAMLARRRRRLA